MDLRSLSAQKYDIGKAAVLAYSEDSAGDAATAEAAGYGEWNTAKNLFVDLVHIGTTEGPVEIAANEVFSDLTIEDTGPAVLKSYLSGESPSFELGLFPNPAAMKAFSPTGTASAGFELRPLVNTITLLIVPAELFNEYTNNVPARVAVTYTGGSFLKDGGALTTEEQRLLDSGLLIWKARFGRLTPRFAHEDGGKSLRNVPVTVMQDFEKPNGCQLYLHLSEIDDYDYELDFEPV